MTQPDSSMTQPDSSLTRSLRIPIIKTDKYTVFFQAIHINDEPYTFVHCDVMDWDMKTFRSLRSDWNTLVDLHNGPLLAINELDDEKHRGFLELFDFKFLQTITGDDGVERNLYFHSLT